MISRLLCDSFNNVSLVFSPFITKRLFPHLHTYYLLLWLPSSPQKNSHDSNAPLPPPLRSLVGSKTITRENVTPVLSQLRDHLVGKNVAADIAAKLCDSVALKLEGKVGISN